MGGDQFFRCDGQSLGCSDKIGFVIGKEVECRCQHRRIAQAFTQGIGIQAGKFKIAAGAISIFQHPAKRGEGKRLRA